MDAYGFQVTEVPEESVQAQQASRGGTPSRPSRRGTPLPPLRQTPQPEATQSHPATQPQASGQSGNRPRRSTLNPEAPEFVYNSFGALPDAGDVTDPDVWPTIYELVDKLLDPPRQAYDTDHGVHKMIRIKLSWVMKTIGEPHFENNAEASRSVLKANSKVRIWGIVCGLPEGYYLWLCGPDHGQRPSETDIDRSEFWIPAAQFHLVPQHLRKNYRM